MFLTPVNSPSSSATTTCSSSDEPPRSATNAEVPGAESTSLKYSQNRVTVLADVEFVDLDTAADPVYRSSKLSVVLTTPFDTPAGLPIEVTLRNWLPTFSLSPTVRRAVCVFSSALARALAAAVEPSVIVNAAAEPADVLLFVELAP